MKGAKTLCLAFLAVAASGACAATGNRLILAGDSTMQSRSDRDILGSWADACAGALRSGFEIVNLAREGRSACTFRHDWDKNVLPLIKPGDWVAIQFGRSGVSGAADPSAPDRRACPEAGYRDSLRRYVRETRERGGNPLLVTPASMYLFDDGGKWAEENPLAPWVEAMHAVAKETGAPIVDLNARTAQAVRMAEAPRAVMWYGKGADGKDCVHLTKTGARIFATLFLFEAAGRCGAFPAVRELDTAAVQRNIDAASAAGGGTVELPEGLWTTTPIALKSDVTLRVPPGCTLFGSTDPGDYAKDRHPLRALVYAKDARNVALDGGGRINGRGEDFAMPHVKSSHKNGTRPHLVNFRGCRNVRVENLVLENGGSWTLNPLDCDGVAIRNIRLWSHVNHCNDGVDISSKNVIVENCVIDADDDALVFKVPKKDTVVENVEVRNCVLASSCNAIKFGTETRGTVRNVTIRDCEIRPTSAQARFDWRRRAPGVVDFRVGLAGIAVETVDGGQLENVSVGNVTMEGCMTPIFVRLGARNAREGKGESFLRNVRIENVKGRASSRIACSITGVPGLKPSGIVLKNVDLVFPGGGTLADAKRRVPEKVKSYPECRMFDSKALPAYGFYIRHTGRVSFENVKLRYEGEFEARPPVVADDAEFLKDASCRFRRENPPPAP